MSEPNSRDHGIEHEPAISGPAGQLDPSEAPAHYTLQNEKGRADSDEETALHSVYNELAIFPAGAVHELTIHCDWSCDGCAYNLRSLNLGHPCPECGHIQVAAPARRDKPSYAMWLKSRISQTTWTRSWLITAGVALLAGPWAILGAIMEGLSQGGQSVAVVIWGPITEEVMKIVLVVMLVEIRPNLFKSSAQLWVAGLAGALMFAVIENILYLTVYIPNPSMAVIAWRWTICVILHMGCTGVATVGLVGVWRHAILELQPAKVSLGLPWLIGAIVLHGGYNLTVSLLEISGYLF